MQRNRTHSKTKTLQVSIPAGIDQGRRIRLAGEGEAGVKGGPPGDLYVLIGIKPHKFFEREGSDLYARVPLPMTKASMGGSVEVPTIEGSRASVKNSSRCTNRSTVQIEKQRYARPAFLYSW